MKKYLCGLAVLLFLTKGLIYLNKQIGNMTENLDLV